MVTSYTYPPCASSADGVFVFKKVVPVPLGHGLYRNPTPGQFFLFFCYPWLQIMSSLPLGLQVGDYVQVTSRSRPQCNHRLFLVHHDQTLEEDRVTLRPTDDPDHSIAVRTDAVTPLPLVPAHVSVSVDADVAMWMRFSWC